MLPLMSFNRYVLVSCLVIFIARNAIVSRADLNSGEDDDEEPLDLASKNIPVGDGPETKHSDEILNSLPKMPTEKPKPVSGKLHIGIKKKATECKREAQKGDRLHMHYRGSLKDGGTEFDNSYKRGDPLVFTLGTGQVIKGWDQGLLGICAGEKRKLIIPPHLAYGEMGSPPTIPGDSTLVFEVEAIKVNAPGSREEL